MDLLGVRTVRRLAEEAMVLYKPSLLLAAVTHPDKLPLSRYALTLADDPNQAWLVAILLGMVAPIEAGRVEGALNIESHTLCTPSPPMSGTGEGICKST